MTLNYVLLDALDDGRNAIIGRDDGRLQYIASDELAKLDLARLRLGRTDADDLEVEYITLEDAPLPVNIDYQGEQVSLIEWSFQGTPQRIIAGYSRKNKTWLVGQYCPAF
jgi:hypothetical protein